MLLFNVLLLGLAVYHVYSTYILGSNDCLAAHSVSLLAKWIVPLAKWICLGPSNSWKEAMAECLCLGKSWLAIAAVEHALFNFVGYGWNCFLNHFEDELIGLGCFYFYGWVAWWTFTSLHYISLPITCLHCRNKRLNNRRISAQ